MTRAGTSRRAWPLVTVAVAALFVVLVIAIAHALTTPALTAEVAANPAPRAIACVGDSITYGAGVQDPDTHAWPALLKERLGDDAVVYNLGVNGRTLLSTGELPYTSEPQYEQSLGLQYASYLIMLGTNDANAPDFDAEAFRDGARQFLQRYVDHAGATHVVVMLPPKVFVTDEATASSHASLDKNIQAELPIIQEVADELGIATIDLYHFTEGHPEWFADGIHPNEEGNRQLADYIYDQLPDGFVE